MSLTERCVHYSSKTTHNQLQTRMKPLHGGDSLTWTSTRAATARFHCLRTGCTPDVFYTSEVLAGVVSSHSRCRLPSADICFDSQPLLSPDILLKMLAPGILFCTLNLNQAHFDPSSDGNSPDLRNHHMPLRKHQ